MILAIKWNGNFQDRLTRYGLKMERTDDPSPKPPHQRPIHHLADIPCCLLMLPRPRNGTNGQHLEIWVHPSLHTTAQCTTSESLTSCLASLCYQGLEMEQTDDHMGGPDLEPPHGPHGQCATSLTSCIASSCYQGQ